MIKQNVALANPYKSFILPHLGYTDIIHDQLNNENPSNKIEI